MPQLGGCHILSDVSKGNCTLDFFASKDCLITPVDEDSDIAALNVRSHDFDRRLRPLSPLTCALCRS